MASSSQTVKVPNGTISTSILIEYFRIFPWGKFHKHGVNVRQLSGFKWRKLQICVVGTWRVCIYIYRYRCMMYIYICIHHYIQASSFGFCFSAFFKKVVFLIWRQFSWFSNSFRCCLVYHLYRHLCLKDLNLIHIFFLLNMFGISVSWFVATRLIDEVNNASSWW